VFTSAWLVAVLLIESTDTVRRTHSQNGDWQDERDASAHLSCLHLRTTRTATAAGECLSLLLPSCGFCDDEAEYSCFVSDTYEMLR